MRLLIKNFRSIQNQEVDLAPITLLYGTNGAGKSSLIYALLTLKNIVLNPNQKPDGFFNYTFLNLGNFDGVVFEHRLANTIDLGIRFEEQGQITSYNVSLEKDSGTFCLTYGDGDDAVVNLYLPVSFPYPANESSQQSITANGKSFNITWNGIVAQVQAEGSDAEAQGTAYELAAVLNKPAEFLRTVGIVPLQRGFFKPYYSSISVSPAIITEDEVATLLSNNKYLVSKVSHYLEQILERDFRLNVQPGTAIFSLDATDRQTGIASELVNEGFGVNQLVHFLARTLYHDTTWMCVEEPEIHLHPKALRSLARAITNMAHDEGKNFVISTHSEAFLVAFLALVAGGELSPSEIACYWAHKDRKITTFEHQSINSAGQIEGGLGSFMEGEMEDVIAFFQPKP